MIDDVSLPTFDKCRSPFGGKNTINSYGCLRYHPAPEIFLKGTCPIKNMPGIDTDLFFKKNLSLQKCNQIILLSSMTSLKTLHI
jgi:hypothetical protein